MNLQILPGAFLSKNSFFSRARKTPKGSRYRDSVRVSEFATSGPFFLKMWKKWIGGAGEPWNCVKVGWKKVILVVFFIFLLFFMIKIGVLTFGGKWMAHQKWVWIKYAASAAASLMLPLLGCLWDHWFHFFCANFFQLQHKIDCVDIWQKITKCRK